MISYNDFDDTQPSNNMMIEEIENSNNINIDSYWNWKSFRIVVIRVKIKETPYYKSMNPFSTKKKTGPFRIIKNQESNSDDEDDMVLSVISEIHNQSSGMAVS